MEAHREQELAALGGIEAGKDLAVGAALLAREQIVEACDQRQVVCLGPFEDLLKGALPRVHIRSEAGRRKRRDEGGALGGRGGVGKGLRTCFGHSFLALAMCGCPLQAANPSST